MPIPPAPRAGSNKNVGFILDLATMPWLIGSRSATNEGCWYRIGLQASQIAAHEHERLRLLFGALFMTARMPAGMTLWIRPRDDGGADLYLPPRSMLYAKDLLRYYTGHPCDPPGPNTVQPFAGDGDRQQPLNPPLRRPRVGPTARSHAPARYLYRSMREFRRAPLSAQMLLIDGQVAPFLRRYIKAWFR